MLLICDCFCVNGPAGITDTSVFKPYISFLFLYQDYETTSEPGSLVDSWRWTSVAFQTYKWYETDSFSLSETSSVFRRAATTACSCESLETVYITDLRSLLQVSCRMSSCAQQICHDTSFFSVARGMNSMSASAIGYVWPIPFENLFYKHEYV